VDPFTILTLLSAGASLIGGAVSAEATAREGAANAAELERSARQAETARLDAFRQGQLAVGRRRLETGRAMGAQRVAFAASGIDGSTGTAAAVAADSERMGELDALQLKANAYREAYGFGEQARGLRMRADQTRRNASTNVFNAIAGGVGGAVTAALPLAKKGG
jgi:hypothetical protein